MGTLYAAKTKAWYDNYRPCVLKMQKNRQENSLKYHSGASSLERKYHLNLAENSLQKRKTFTPLATANSLQAFL